MWYKMSGKTSYGLFFTLFGAALTVVLNVMLVPKMGYMGAAWATLGCYASMMVASYIIGQINYRVPYQTGRILFYVLLAFLFYALSELFVYWITPSTAVKIMFNTMCFAGYIVLMGRLERPPVIKS
jgi:O-antigen/teichoic acid export membrane protein